MLPFSRRQSRGDSEEVQGHHQTDARHADRRPVYGVRGRPEGQSEFSLRDGRGRGGVGGEGA